MYRISNKKTIRSSDKYKSAVRVYFQTAWPILFLMLLVGICSYLVIARIAFSQDQGNANSSQQLLTKSLEAQASINMTIAKELSISKGAFENITLRRNDEWVQENFQSPNTSAILVYSASEGLISTSILDQYNQYRPAIQSIARTIGQTDATRQNQEQLVNDFKRDDPTAFVLLGGQLAAVSSQPIRRKDRGLQASGASAQDYVVTIKFLSDYHAEAIGRALGLKQLAFVRYPTPSTKKDPKLLLPVSDTDGNVLGWFEWADEKRGTATLNRHLLPIGAGLAFLFILTAFVTRRSFRIQLSAQNARVAAETASRLKSTFLANMSHELRTPLNAIIGYSEMLHEDCLELDYKTGASDANKITRSAHHLLALINDLLDHSKIEAGKMDLNPQVHEIATIVEEVADALRSRVVDNNSTLIVHCDPLVGAGFLDGMRLKQCLLNLVSNAAKFTQSGTIVVTVRSYFHEEVSHLRFSIRDTGIGMSPETVQKLFAPFVQADETTAQNFGGTGLGLAITKKLIEAMGGNIQVESALNEGSTFTLSVPRGIEAERVPLLELAA